MLFRSRVDGHRGVHAVERDLLEEGPHVVDMADRHTDIADLPAGEWMVRVVSGLGRQIEGDGEAALATGEIAAIQHVAGRSEERRVGKSVDLGGRRIIKKKNCGTSTLSHSPMLGFPKLMDPSTKILALLISSRMQCLDFYHGVMIADGLQVSSVFRVDFVTLTKTVIDEFPT